VGYYNRFESDVKTSIGLYSASIATLENLSCKACGSKTKVEMHHINKMKNINKNLDYVSQLMIRIKRKQIPLCRVCHMQLHKGKFHKKVK
jgi:thymidine kinase